MKRNTLTMHLEDNGSGFLGDASKLFQKFYREEGNLKMGTGIGLSISKSIIELHGGKIWAENKETGGARFSIEFHLINIVQ
jgi:signal transduction histidine kinase